MTEPRDVWEMELARALARTTQQELNRLLDALGDPPHLANVPAAYWNEYSNRLTEVLTPALTAIYIEQAGAQAEEPPPVDGQPSNRDRIKQAAATWAAIYVLSLVRKIQDNTRTGVEAKLENVPHAPMTVAEVRDALTPLFGPVRAETIAVTEVTRASIEGQRALVNELNQTGTKLVARWATYRDDRVCPICAPLDGLREGDGWTEPPPAHPRCRCELLYAPD